MSVSEKIVDVVPKIRTKMQVSGLAIAVAAVVLIRIYIPEAKNAQISAGAFGVLFLIFGQIFAHLGDIPLRSRATFLFRTFVLFCVFILALISLTAVLIAIDRPRSAEPAFSPAEQKLLGIQDGLDMLRGRYESLAENNFEAVSVNAEARRFAEQLQTVADDSLTPGFRIFKYELTAYAWVFAAGSESDPAAKSKLGTQIIDASKHALDLISELKAHSSENEKLQQAYDWVISQDAVPRAQRWLAIGLCAQWQFDKDKQKLLQIRDLIQNLPSDFRKREKPENSREIKPCWDARIV